MVGWYKTSLFWGKKAAGCVFICLEDQTILLLKRSRGVENPGTWGIAGGAIVNEDLGMEDDFYNQDENHIPDPDQKIFKDSAIDETVEEMGSFPGNSEMLGSTDFSEGSFTYRTHIYNISLEEKQKWTPTIRLNLENDKYGWFSIMSLPPNLQPGFATKVNEIKQYFGQPFNLKRLNS